MPGHSPWPKKPVIVNGVRYESVWEAARQTGEEYRRLLACAYRQSHGVIYVEDLPEGAPIPAPATTETVGEAAVDPTQWPRYVFHRRHPPALVQTPSEERALGAGWQRLPYHDEEATSPDAPSAPKALATRRPVTKQKRQAKRSIDPNKEAYEGSIWHMMTRELNAWELKRMRTPKPFPTTKTIVQRSYQRRHNWLKKQAAKERSS